MEFLESIKSSTEILNEIYKKTKPQLSTFLLAPNFDTKNWDSAMMGIDEEEPLSVLCICVAESKGFFTFNSTITFTNEKLYLAGFNGAIKFSDIKGFEYKEEEKTSLFGKSKNVGHLLFKKQNGETKDLKGNYATKEISDFLNEAIDELKKNPPPALPPKDSTHAETIAKKIKEYFSDNLGCWQFKPKISNGELNSVIIKHLKTEYKSSCSAYYYNSSAFHRQKFFFFNDTLVVENKDSDGTSVIKYKDLAYVRYEEKKDEYGKILKKIILSNAKNEDKKITLSIEDTSLVSEKTAEFFKWLIFEETGNTINIGYDTIAKKEEKEREKEIQEKEKLIDREIKNGAIKKYDVGTKDYLIVSVGSEDYETWTNLLKKWNEIFKQENQWKFINSKKKEYIGGMVNTLVNTSEYVANNKKLIYSRKLEDFHRPVDHTSFSFIYSPEPNKKLVFYHNTGVNYDFGQSLPLTHGGYSLEMKSNNVLLNFIIYDLFAGTNFQEVITIDMLSEKFGIPDLSINIEKFKDSLESVDITHENERLENLKRIENNHRNDFADW